MTKITEFDINKPKELELLSSIAINAENPILIIEKSGVIKWVNSAFQKVHNYTLDDGEKYLSNYSSAFFQLLHETDSDFLSKNNYQTFTRKISSINGEEKWIQSSVTPIMDDNSNVIRFIVIETDVTDKKELEEDLLQRWENTQTVAEYLESIKEYVENQVNNLTNQKKILQEAKEKSENILNKVIPYEVAIQLKKKGYAVPRKYKKATVLHLNIRNFTELSNTTPIDDLVKQLHESMVAFDTILEEHFVEKIQSVGGIYIGAGGVPLRNRSNPIDVVLTALEIRNTTIIINKERINKNLSPFNLGFGIHTGKLIAGVVGKNKLSYDIWGDTVNIASSIEQNSHHGRIIISNETHANISDYFDTKEEPNNKTKETKIIKLFDVLRIKPEYSEDSNGSKPNSKFKKILSRL